MEFEISVTAIWSLIVGGAFLLSALARGPMKSLPISMPVCYLAIGIGIGPWGFGLLKLDIVKDAKLVEVLSEIAVLVCLLTSGMRLPPLKKQFFKSAVPLATVGMAITILGIAALGYFWLGLSIGAAVLLGAVLAPTDPVLAGEVQVKNNDDRDRLRYALTGEAGLNDGAAFPFIMLGLGLLGVHELGDGGWKWISVDLFWGTVMGVLSGWATGLAVSRLAIWLKRSASAPTVCEELLTLGLIGLSYGVAMAIGGYGFLAVFAAGVALRRNAKIDDEDEHPEKTLDEVTVVNEQFERILEAAMVVMTGVLLASAWSLPRDWWMAIVLFLLIRPVASFTALLFSDTNFVQKSLVGFFGLRGIGSLYYLTYAIGKGMNEDVATRLAQVVLTTVVLSLFLHSTISSVILSVYRSDQQTS